MNLRLLPPAASLNWLLVAENLADAPNWSQFLLNHEPGSDRYRFEDVAQQVATELGIQLADCRRMCKRGSCAFEYNFGTDEGKIKSHHGRVAEMLGLNNETPVAVEAPVEAERIAG